MALSLQAEAIASQQTPSPNFLDQYKVLSRLKAVMWDLDPMKCTSGESKCDNMCKCDENERFKGESAKGEHEVGSLEKSENLREGALSLAAGECDRRLLVAGECDRRLLVAGECDRRLLVLTTLQFSVSLI